MNMFAKAWLLGMSALLSVMLVQPANAIVITTSGSDPLVGLSGSDVGDDFGVNWNVPAGTSSGTGSSLSTDLNATSSFTVDSFNADQLVLDVTVKNLTEQTFQSSITSLGLTVSPDVTVAISGGSVFTAVGTGSGGQQTFPGGFKNINLCVYGSNGCSGGNINSGLLSGQSDSFKLTLTSTTSGGFSSSTSSSDPQASLGAFALKWQTAQGSFETGGTPFLPVPAPSTSLLLMTGFLGLVFSRRGRNTAGAKFLD